LIIDSNRITSHTNATAPSGANGIEINNAPIRASIDNNFIGTDGATDLGNQHDGIFVTGRADVSIENNLISGNNRDGVRAVNLDSRIVISENFIGTQASGLAGLGNIGYGVLLRDSDPLAHLIVSNVIGGNVSGGVAVDNTPNVQIGGGAGESNWIGVAPDGTTPVGNAGHGIELANGSHEALIQGNFIGYNGQDGISLGLNAGSNNRITNNLTFGNGGLGIDLANDGVTLNDATDLDGGPNGRLNFPVLEIKRRDGSVWNLRLTYDTRLLYSGHRFDFEYYFTSTPDPTGYGEGAARPALGGGTQQVLQTVGSNAHVAFDFSVSATQGSWLTALATARGPMGNATRGDTSEFAKNISLLDGDLNQDGIVDRTDVAVLTANYGKSSGVTWYQGDLTGDGKVGAADLSRIQSNITPGGEGLVGGGGGGEEMSGGGEGGGGEEMSGGGGAGGGESFSGTPARFYFTTSASTSGGGALGTSVPSVTLPSPGQATDLYVWVKMGSNDRLKGFGFDVRATTPGVLKATESQVYNADIWDLEYDEDAGDRWNSNALLGGSLNPSGVGAAELAIASGSFGIGGGTDLLDRYDGTNGVLDTLYDAANDAFLLQRVRLEALPGSAGLSTGLVLSIGRLGIVLDDTSITNSVPIYFGLGTASIENNDIGATDGSTHATIAVAPGSPGAVLASATDPATRARAVDAVHTPAMRASRRDDAASIRRPAVESASSTQGPLSIRAVRRVVDQRAADRLLAP
jgi:hypothetical protein